MSNDYSDDTAIIGMAGRFPGANNIDEFWENIKNGVNTISMPMEAQEDGNGNYVRVNTTIEGIDMFDASFFGFSRREAEIMDPQHRLFLECAWEALENAGYHADTYPGVIGLYAGMTASTYLLNNLYNNRDILDAVGYVQAMIGNDKDHLTARVGYKLNLRGPLVTIQASCATSLVAVHFGCESLLNGQCDMALAGGITIKIPQTDGYFYTEGGLLSPDGYLRAFDAAAQGTVYSNGVGIVVLKRLEDALADGDTIYARIKGSAVNNDGAARVGYTAPGVEGQAEVIAEAQAVARVEPETLQYIETHGTGTPLGDTIEIQALIRVFKERMQSKKKGFCALGSVKTNIGHMEMAAGAAGLIKTALALKHEMIPPSLNFQEPNPKIDLSNSPFYVNTLPSPWPTNGKPRRAGVSSFGLGGANAHVVLEEAPGETEQIDRETGKEWELLLLSAKSPAALETAAKHLAACLKKDIHPADAAYTLKVGRKRFNHRLAVLYQTKEDAVRSLENPNPDRVFTLESHVFKAPVVFLFPDQDKPPLEPACRLYREVKEFRKQVDLCAALFKEELNVDLKEIFSTGEKVDDFSKTMPGHTGTAKAIGLVIQYCLARFWMDWGVEPKSLHPEGTGQWAAACISGLLSLEEGLQRVIKEEAVDIGEMPEAVQDKNRVLLEMIPGDTLKGLPFLQEQLARLWLAGVPIDWIKYYSDEKHRRVPLPTYPFEGQRYWIEPKGQVWEEPSLAGQPIQPDQLNAVITRTWEEALGVTIHDINDNFFELGGHSLLATQVLFNLRKTFEIDIPMQTFFESPTIPGLAGVIAAAREKGITREQEYIPLPAVTVSPEERYQPFPLTDVQQAYWIGRAAGIELGNVATHIYFENDVQDLDIKRFNRALQQLIRRHDMLRAIVLADGQQQVLKEVPPYEVETQDLREAAPAERKRLLDITRQEMSHQVLPGDQWPLFDIRASRLPGGYVRLHISFDLLIGDAWSLEILLSELAQLYRDPGTYLPELELTFRDYVLTLVSLEDTRLFLRSKDYWLERLDTLAQGPELPLAKDPSLIKKPTFKRRRAQVDKETWTRLKKQAGQLGLTPTVLLLAAFAEVLTTWCKNPRFTLNLTLFNRLPMHAQVNDIIGDFTSLTLLEVDNGTPAPFGSRARCIQARLWEDLDHRYFSGVRVTRELVVKLKDPSRAVMPVVFTSILNLGEGDWEPPQETFAPAHREEEEAGYSISQTPQVWLDHQVLERGGVLQFNWDVVEDMFPPGLMDEMFATYCDFLFQLAAEETWQMELPLQAYKKHLQPLLDKHRVTKTFPQSNEMLHTLFMEQALKTPGRQAVVTRQKEISYQELDRCSNALASRLKEFSIPANTLAAVVMEKGWEQAAAVLGILKAGAAYMPVDANLPQERIDYLLKVGEVQVVLTQPHVAPSITWPKGLHIIEVTEDLLDHPAARVEVQQQPGDLAYVIFTSGSTGLPKGVKINHRGAVNTILDINERFRVGPDDRVFALSSLSFDLSVYDIFGPLAVGGTVMIPDAAHARDPCQWQKMLLEKKVTVWNSVPALMRMLVEYGKEETGFIFPDLRLVLLSGDWIPLDLPGQIRQLNNSVEVISLGGATEASIWSILFPIGHVDPLWKSIPYGMSMKNQTIYVLNRHLQPCPIWVPGHLYIAGMGVAKGYWRDQERTNQSFLQHPYTNETIYRTGDMGRYLPDGNIEFLGREDLQVKIQGFRVELGEIEAALNQHPLVKETVVTVDEDSRGNKQLLAFVVTHQENKEDTAYQPMETEEAAGLIVDPAARFRFKLQEPGIRKNNEKKDFRLEKVEGNTDQYIKRRSYRKFSDQAISYDQFGRFLSCLAQESIKGVPVPKYLYGSGGGLYPVQTYIYVKPGRVQGLEQGIYYHHPGEHTLLLISADAHIHRGIHVDRNQEIFDASAFSIFLVGRLDAMTPMYGEKESRHFIMLEAGMMTQLLEMTAPEFDLGLCQIGVLDFEAIRHLFDLEESHIYLHCLVGGRIHNRQTRIEGITGEWNTFEQQHQQDTPAVVKPSLTKVLAAHLEQKLPHYMVPSRIRMLDQIPLTPNGKVDRKALARLTQQRTPDRGHVEDEARTRPAYEPPKTGIEKKIVQTWKEIFPDIKIGVKDNFFELGGNSISLVQVFRELQKAFDKEITMVDLFKYPTIRALAKFLGEAQDTTISFQEDLERARAREMSLRRRSARQS